MAPVPGGTVPGMGWPVQVVEVTGSTSADLLQEARAGGRGPRFLAARAQTAGRGRLDRGWHSPPGASLAVSLLFAPEVPQAGWTWLPMVVGLGVLDALRGMGATAVLKWPNDVVVPLPEPGGGATGTAGTTGPPEGAMTGLAKLAGVLVQGVAGSAGPVAVVGVGLNLRPPGDVGARSASLADLLDGDAPDGPSCFDRVLPALTGALTQRLLGWEADGGRSTGTRAAYLRACSTMGRQVRVSTPAGQVSGRAVDVAEDGALVLDGPDGRVRVLAGDVEHVR